MSTMRNVLVAAALAGLWAMPAMAHPNHGEPSAYATLLRVAQNANDISPDKVSGDGEFKFRVFQTNAILPDEAQAHLVKAHGGFAVDRRDGKGEVYFALPNVGIIRVASDLSSTTLVPTPEQMIPLALHNTTIWHGGGVDGYLTFPDVSGNGIFTTDLNGEFKNAILPPGTDADFGPEPVRKYFQEGGKFVPTDTEHHDGTIYAVTGYSPLDYVLTAKVEGEGAFDTSWTDLAWGGKGDEPGQFQTAHGITNTPDGNGVAIANRADDKIDYFDYEGKLDRSVHLPEGSRPCDVDFAGGYAVVACLNSPEEGKGAPAYIMKGDEIVSTIWPREDLGLGNFAHIHNAVLVETNDRFYLVLQAWNPGDFAILEQVK